MEVTDVKVKLVSIPKEKLLAFCTVTLDREFVLRDVKVINGPKGAFIAMPSRKLTDRCPSCGGKNHLRAAFCNDCGARLNPDRAPKDANGRSKLYVDISHPINSGCRQKLERSIIQAYQKELERSKQPDYVPPSLDDEDDYLAGEPHGPEAPGPRPVSGPVQ